MIRFGTSSGWGGSALPALMVVAGFGAAGCRIDAVATPTCVIDDDCGAGNACTAGTCIPQGTSQGGGTWAIELVPRSDSSAATTRLSSVTFSDDVTVLSAEGKQTVMGMLAPGASLAGASHMVATLQTAIPGYTDLQIETDSTLPTGASDAWFTFNVPTGALNRMATFRLIPLPPRDVAQPPVTVTARLTPTVNLAYSSNYYFITGRLISPAQVAQPDYAARAFEDGQLVSSVDNTSTEGRFRLAIPVDAAYPTTGLPLTVELTSGGASLRFSTPPILLTNHLVLGDLVIPAVPAVKGYRLKVTDASRQPVAGAVVRVHTDVSFDHSGAIDFTRDGVTDASGNVELMLLTGTSSSPRSYDIAVAPPPGSRFGSTCLTGFQITDQTPASQASPSAIATSLSVPEKATLPGTILSATGVVVAGVTVAATRIAPDPTVSCGKAALPSAATSTTSGRDGTFQLMLDPGMYQLDYDPPAGAPVPRLTESAVSVAASNESRVVPLLPGALIKGAVRDAVGAPLPFAGVRFLQVACVGQDACYGRNRVGPIVRGDTHSDADGTFRVVVPLQCRSLPPGALFVGDSVPAVGRDFRGQPGYDSRVMRAIGSVPGFFVVVAVVAMGWGYGCGRTSLDDGFGPATGLGGAADSGTGGRGTGGLAGLGGMSGLGGNVIVGLGGSNAPNPCGATSCQAGTQTCCTRVGMGPATQTCIPAGATCNGGITTACVSSSNCAPGLACCLTLPTLATTCQSAGQCAANGQFILCTSTGACPAPTPRCCIQAQGLGLCLPASAPCPAPR